jgi:quinol monooxygenase YgiN
VLTVIAMYKTKPGKSDEVAAILARHVAATRAEPGCVQFVANRSGKDPDRFVLFEQYVDEASFDAHRTSSHFARYIENGVVPLLEERAWDRYMPVEP